MNDEERSDKRIADFRKQRGPDPTPSRPRKLDVPDKEWEQAWIAVLNLGLRITRSLPRAEDIRQQAYLRLLTSSPWVRERQPSFVKHMLLTASSVLKNENASERSRREYEAEAGAEYKRDRGDKTQSAERDMLDHARRERERERAIRAIAELRRRLAAFPLELRIIDYAEKQEASDEEFGTSSEVAEALQVPVQEVYRALARIRRYKESVYAAVGGNEDEESE
jgi:hypothetical protein